MHSREIIGYPYKNAICGKLSKWIFIRPAYSNSADIFTPETTLRPFAEQNTNKPLWALGLVGAIPLGTHLVVAG